MKKIGVLILLLLIATAGFLIFNSNKNETNKVQLINNEIKSKSDHKSDHKLEKKDFQSINIKRKDKPLADKVEALNHTKRMNEVSKDEEYEDDEIKFNRTLGIEPLTSYKLADIAGNELRERLQLLDSSFNRAIEQNEDLPETPLWFEEEMEILLNRYFSTTGKSTHKTQVSAELKRKKREYRELMEHAVKTKNMELIKKLPEIKRRYFEENQ